MVGQIVLGLVVLDPPVVEGFVGLVAVLDLPRPELLDEIFDVVRSRFEGRVFEVELARGHSLEDLHVVLAVEGRSSADENVEDHSERPVVALLGVVAFEHLWGDVEGLK